MKVAVIQTDPIFGDTKHNVAQALDLIASAEADLYVLPELFNTGYNFAEKKEVEALSETADGPTARAMIAEAQKRNAHIVYGFAERDDALYNSALVAGPEGAVGIYRKMHLYYREKLFFSRGNLGFPVFDLPWGRLGVMICFDWMFPESARSLALKGAHVVAHPANLVLRFCPDAMITRCLENKIFAATSNRVGTEDRGGVSLTYTGKSELVTPEGEIVFRMGETGAGVRVAEIDPRQAVDKRLNELNDLFADRRDDAYGKG